MFGKDHSKLLAKIQPATVVKNTEHAHISTYINTKMCVCVCVCVCVFAFFSAIWNPIGIPFGTNVLFDF